MTDRFTLLNNAIAASNHFMVIMFLFALTAVIAYMVLDWTPAWMRRPAKYLYLVFLLAAFLTTVYFGSV